MAGLNINQLTNQAFTIQASDKMYIGRSPYNLGDDFYILGSSIINQFVSSTTGVTNPGASTATFLPMYMTTLANGAVLAQTTLNYDALTGVLSVKGLSFSDNTQPGLTLQPLTSGQISGITPSAGSEVFNTTLGYSEIGNGSTWGGYNATYWYGIPLQQSSMATPATGSIPYFNGTDWIASTTSSAGILTSSNLSPANGLIPYAIGTGDEVLFNTNLYWSGTTLEIAGLPVIVSSSTSTQYDLPIYTDVTGQKLQDSGLLVDPTTGGLALGNLEFKDSTQAGLRPNNLTQTEINALTPSFGQIVANTTTALPNFWNGSVWLSPTNTPIAGFFTTVGVGGEYPDIPSAYNAGKHSVIVISNVNDTSSGYLATSDVNLFALIPTGTTYEFNGSGINLAMTSSSLQFIINGDLTRFYSGAAAMIYSGGGAPSISLSGTGTITDLTTGPGPSYLVNCLGATASQFEILNLTINSANYIYSGCQYYSGLFSNVVFNGGGSSCTNVLNGQITVLDNVSFSGTYDSVLTTKAANLGLGKGTGIYNFTGQVIGLGYAFQAQFTNMGGNNQIALLPSTGAIASISQANAVDFVLSDGCSASFSECGIQVINDSSATSSGIISFNQCVFANGFSSGSNSQTPFKFSQCQFDAQVSLNSNNCTVSMSQVSNGSNATIVINSTAAGAKVVYNETDVSVINNGSSSTISGNTII